MPKFLVWVPGDMDDTDGSEIEAYGPDDAAAEFCEENDHQCADYPDEQIVMVRDESGTDRVFVVWAESVRQYHAHEEDS